MKIKNKELPSGGVGTLYMCITIDMIMYIWNFRPQSFEVLLIDIGNFIITIFALILLLLHTSGFVFNVLVLLLFLIALSAYLCIVPNHLKYY